MRATLPQFIDLQEGAVPEEDLTVYEGLRSTTVARALLDCRGLVMTERLLDAAKQAKAEGLIIGRDYPRVRRALTQRTQAA